MKIFSDLETAVIGRLSELKPALIKTIEVYAGQLDADTVDDITFRFPAVYVIAGDLRSEDHNRNAKTDISLEVMVGAMTIRGLTESGVYEIMQAVYEKLHGLTFSNHWSALSLERIGAVAYSQLYSIVIYSMRYKARGVM